MHVNDVGLGINRASNLHILAIKTLSLLLVVEVVNRPLLSFSKNKFSVSVRDSSGKCSHVQV